jgi:hypothetical protein
VAENKQKIKHRQIGNPTSFSFSPTTKAMGM